METNKPVVKLIGTDGNVFGIIGRVSAALKKAGMPDEAKTFCENAMACESYNEVLILCTEVCDVR